MKASGLLFIIVLLSITIGSTSCKWKVKNNSSNEDSTKVDTLWNAKVQDTFFDTKFGASKEEIIRNFAKHGFRLDKQYSEKDFLIFYHIPKNRFDFGGMIWEKLDVFLTNGKFQSIRFYTPTKDKATAISVFNEIVDVVSEKYKLTTIEPEDTIIYGKKRAYCKSGVIAWIDCYRYESLGKSIYYTTELGYGDTNITEEVSDEL